MHRRFFAAALAIFLVLFARETCAEQQRRALDHPFTLVDADGRSVSSDDFAGKWLLLYFGYTHCADQCPTALSALVEALDEIGPAADQIQPLFVTVDPERDHGPLLRDFTAAFDKRLIGLTGPKEHMADAAHMFGVKYQTVLTGNDNYVIDHSTSLAAVGPERREAVTFAFAEPYLIAAKLVELLEQSGAPLGNVNNLRAYR